MLVRMLARDFMLPQRGASQFACWTEPGQRLVFSITWQIAPPVPPRGLLCAFGFSEPAGPAALRGSGMAYSDKLGAYCYVATPVPDGRAKLQVQVPDGLELVQFSLRRWDGAGEALIRALQVEQEAAALAGA